MATPRTTDQRRSSAVRSLSLCGLASLSFGKLLIGAAMVWMAAIFISAQPGSGSAEPDAAASPAVELVAYDDQNSDAADEADWSFSFGAGEKKSAPVNNGGRTVAKLDGHMATMATATAARSLAELRARHSPVATEPMAADTAEWPFGVRHDGHSGGQPSAATAPDPGRPMSRMVHSEVEPTIDSALEFAAKLVDRLAGATTGGTDEPLAEAPSWTRPSASGNRSSSGRALPAPAAERVDELMGGVVDLASGIVGAVAGQQAGDRTRQALTGLAQQVSTALTAGNRLGRHGSEFQPAMPERDAKQPPHEGGPGVTPERGREPITCQALGCPDPNPGLNGRDPGVGGGRGPPADHRARYQHDSPDENDPASRAGTIDNSIGGIRNPDGNEDISQLAEDFVSSLLKLLGIDGGSNANADEAGQALGDPGPFSDDLDYWKGLYHDAFMAEANAANQQQGAQRQAPDLGQAMDRFNELASGLVADVAGGDAGKQTRQALGALSDRLRPGGAANGGDPERTARRADLDADRAGSIQELAQGFVADLLESLGLARPRETGAGQAAPPGRQPPDGLGGDIAELTDDFVSDLLEMLGGKTPSAGGSGGPGASGGGVQRPEGLDEFAQLLGGVTDLVSGLVGTVAGERAGTQARELLTAAAQDVLAALAAGQNGDTGAGPNGGQAAPGAGQENSWGLNNDGQFAGTPCEGEIECALANDDLRTRQPQSLANRGPPQLLNDPTGDTEQALEDRLALVKGEKSLKAAKADLKAGEISKAAYEKKAAAHKKLRAEAARSAARLDPYDAQLLDDVVTGQRELAPAKAELAESKKQLNAGKISQATYDRRSAAYREQRDEVYGQTAQLRELAGYGDAARADPGRDGAGAACANTGAFAECSSAVIDPKTGEIREDQSFCLLGLSGCASKSKIGNRTASATCDPDKGCTTSGKAGKTTARTECGAGECNTAATADAGGTVTFCQARHGCAEHGRTPTPPAAKGKKPGVSGTDSECTEDCALAAFANRTEAGADCATRNGKCDNNSTGRPGNRATGNLTAKGEATSEAHCRASAIGCDTTTTVRAGIDPTTGQQGWLADDQNSSGEAAAEAIVRCAIGAKGCSGNAETSTGGRTKQTPAGADAERRSHTGTARCTVKRGGCTASSGLGETEEMLAHSDIDCDRAKGCKGKASTATKARITTGTGDDKATRKTAAEHKCKIRGTTGDCANDASSAVANPGPDGPTADSRTVATLACGSADCKARESGSTSGRAEDDVKGQRDSEGVTGCATYGVDRTCGSAAGTTVIYRAAQTGADGRVVPAGVVSLSKADAQVRCANSPGCGGRSEAETSALDTSVSKHRRGSSDTAGCTVDNGDCLGQTSSDGSSAADYIKIDPKTGKPLRGQPTSGPTSTSRASASVDCQAADCQGTAYTKAAAWDGAVDGGKPRTSEGTVGCEKGATTCQVQTLSNATTGPGAALTYAGTDAEPNAKRLGQGPSAASVIGGKLTGEGGGKLTGTVLATNPGVSDQPRGNKAGGGCAGATGGSCTAVINGGASTGPDANTIKPMVTDSPTSNATSTNTQVGGGQGSGGGNAKQTASRGGEPAGQPGQNPNQPATAPGSSASTGGPSVPGASSWTAAWAALNCTGDTPCQGSPSSSATGITGDDHNTGGEGSRGPPAATGKTTATCDTTGSACQALSNSSAASGQVVADIFTEQNKATVEQAKQQAADAKTKADQATKAAQAPGATAEAKKNAEQAGKAAEQATKQATDAAEAIKKPIPADQVPASWSQSSSAAQCSGPGCKATTTGDVSGTPGTSHTDATCTGACTVTSDATATLMRDSGQRTAPKSKKDKGAPIPGAAGTGEAGSNLICPEGCTGKVTGKAHATAGEAGSGRAPSSAPDGDTAGQGEHHSTSTGEGSTACDGTGPCQAGIRARASTMSSDPSVPEDQRFTATSASVAASCATDAGSCPTKASSRTETVGAAAVKAASKATCDGKAACIAGTTGTATQDMAQVGYQCGGTNGCKAEARGDARAGGSSGTAVSDCALTKSGQCAGGAQVGASPESGSLAGAGCQGTSGAARCDTRAESSAGPSTAKAKAHGSGKKRGDADAVQANVMTSAAPGSAQAQAGCTGAKNCAYSARAGAHDYYELHASAATPDTPSGYGKADASGSCRGTTKGGCGVQARADARSAIAEVSCTGDCSNFTKEQEHATGFVQTGPSYNQQMRAAHEVKDLKEWMESLEEDEEALGYKKTKGGYKIYTKEAGSTEVEVETCKGSECDDKLKGGGGEIDIPDDGGNAEVTRPSKKGEDKHKCDATVGCALAGEVDTPGDGKKPDGGGKYWLQGEGDVHDGLTGSDMHFENTKPSKKHRSHRNEGGFGSTKGKPFEFTCNGGCKGKVKNYDLTGDGAFTDEIDIQDTPNLLTGRDGLGNLGNYSHYGPGHIVLTDQDGNKRYIDSKTKDGLTPERWADVVTKEGYTPWDVETLEKVLDDGDTLTAFQPDGEGGIDKITKDKYGKVKIEDCDECESGDDGIGGGGDGSISFDDDGNGTVEQTTAPGEDKSRCTSNVSCGIATDADGSGMWWLTGSGSFKDGASGSTVEYGNQEKKTNNGGTTANTTGDPFTASCKKGCVADVGYGKRKDHFDLEDAQGVLITARDALGNAGQIQWSGKGHFKGDEGDELWADRDADKIAIDPDDESRDNADTTTLVVTRDAAGNGGYYAMPTGQDGRIETKEGYVVDNRHEDKVNKKDADPEGAYNYRHEWDSLRVITPNEDGKGGKLQCSGKCTVEGPGLPEKNKPCEKCTWTEYLATGEGAHPGGWREIWNRGKKQTWYTNEGDKQTCDNCQFTQYNRDEKGNGGGAICQVMGGDGLCEGASREGTKVSDGEGTRLLYENADGSHTGWACKSNKDSCGTDGKNLRFDWGRTDKADASWALVMDSGYRRPATGSQLDKDLAKKLGLDEGDSLPMLTADGLERLKAEDAENGTHYAEEYLAQSPVLTTSDTNEWAYRYLEAQSTDRRLQKKYGPLYEKKIVPALEAYEDANADHTLTAGEKKKLQKKFDALDGVDPGMVYEWSAARGIIDGVDDATYVRPDIKMIEAELAGNDKLVDDLAGPEPVNPAQPGYGKSKMDRALDKVKSALGVDDEGKPNGAYDPSQIATLSLRPMQVDLDQRTAGYLRDAKAYNKDARAYQQGGGSPADLAGLTERKDKLDGRWADIKSDRGELVAGAESIGGEPDPARDMKQSTLRAIDEAFARASGDKTWSDRLTDAYEGLERIQGVYDKLNEYDPQQKKWKEKLSPFRTMGTLNYGAVSRNPTERADDNPIRDLALPSTGKNDLLRALTSAKNLPGYQNYDKDDLKKEWAELTPDELANRASYMSVGQYEQSVRGRSLGENEQPGKKVLDAVDEVGGDPDKIDAERMLYREGGTGEWIPTMLYRVKDSEGNVVAWISPEGEYFTSLQDYREANTLAEDSELITREDWYDPDSRLMSTSAHHSNLGEKAVDYVLAPAAIIGGTIASFTGLGASVGVPLIIAGSAWYVGRAVENIASRANHGQSNGFDNPAAVADYISLGATALVGVGALLRPLAAGASLGVRAAAAAPGYLGMGAFTTMYGYSAYSTVANWDQMTPGQQDEAIAGLIGGGLMLASPVAGKGIGAGLRSGRINPSWAGIRNAPAMRPMADNGVSRPAIDILGETLRPGRAVPMRDVVNHAGLSEKAISDAVSGQGRKAEIRVVTDAEGNPMLVNGRARPGSEFLNIRDIVSQRGTDNGNGGRTMTVEQVNAELRSQGIQPPGDAATARMMNRTPDAEYSGKGPDAIITVGRGTDPASGPRPTTAPGKGSRPATISTNGSNGGAGRIVFTFETTPTSDGGMFHTVTVNGGTGNPGGRGPSTGPVAPAGGTTKPGTPPASTPATNPPGSTPATNPPGSVGPSVHADPVTGPFGRGGTPNTPGSGTGGTGGVRPGGNGGHQPGAPVPQPAAPTGPSGQRVGGGNGAGGDGTTALSDVPAGRPGVGRPTGTSQKPNSGQPKPDNPLEYSPKNGPPNGKLPNSDTTPSPADPFGPQDKCGCVTREQLNASDPRSVDPAQVRPAQPADHKTSAQQGYAEHTLDGYTDLAGPSGVRQRIGDAPPGTRFIVWIKGSRENAGHMIAAWRNPETGRVEFFEGGKVTAKAPKGTKGFTEIGAGKNENAPTMADHIGEFVGARHGRPHERGTGDRGRKAIPGPGRPAAKPAGEPPTPGQVRQAMGERPAPGEPLTTDLRVVLENLGAAGHAPKGMTERQLRELLTRPEFEHFRHEHLDPRTGAPGNRVRYYATPRERLGLRITEMTESLRQVRAAETRARGAANRAEKLRDKFGGRRDNAHVAALYERERAAHTSETRMYERRANEIERAIADAERLNARIGEELRRDPHGPDELPGAGRPELPTAFDASGRPLNGDRHWLPENAPKTDPAKPEPPSGPGDHQADRPTRAAEVVRAVKETLLKGVLTFMIGLKLVVPTPEVAVAHFNAVKSISVELTSVVPGGAVVGFTGKPPNSGSAHGDQQTGRHVSPGETQRAGGSQEKPGNGPTRPSTALSDNAIPYLWRDRLLAKPTLNVDEEPPGEMHFDGFGRTEIAADRVAPPGVNGSDWAKYTRAQKMEAWRNAAEGLHERADRTADQVLELEDRLREHTSQSTEFQEEPDGLILPGDELAKAAERRAADITPALEFYREYHAALSHRATVADEYAAMHREMADKTRSGRRQLTEIETYQADGISSAQVADGVWRQRVFEQLRRTEISERDLVQLAALPSDQLRGVLAAGIVEPDRPEGASKMTRGERAAAMRQLRKGSAKRAREQLENIAERNRITWDDPDALFASLPRGFADFVRATTLPRNAAWRYKQKRSRTILRVSLTNPWLRWGVWVASAAALVVGGGFAGAAALGGGIPAVVLGGMGIGLAGAGLVRMRWHPARARGPPPALLASGPSLLLSGGLSLFGVFGAPALALLAGGIVLSIPLAARLLTAKAGTVRKAVVAGLISLLALTGVTDALGADHRTSIEAVSVSAEQVTVESEARPSEFLIVPGDTATSVTDRLDVTRKAMAAANPQVTDWNLIVAGQHLNLPESWPGTFELDRDLWSVADRFGIEDADGDNGWREVRDWNAAKIADRPLDALPEGLELTVVAPAPEHPDHPEPPDHPEHPEPPGQPDPAGPEQPAPGLPWSTWVTGLVIALGGAWLLAKWRASRPDGIGAGHPSSTTSGRSAAARAGWLLAGAGALVAALVVAPLVTVLQVGAGALLVFLAVRAVWGPWREQDTPLLPGQRRTWLAAGSLFGLGLGGALMMAGPPGVWEAAGFGLLVASLGTAAKVGRSAQWYQKNRAGPPATGSRAARVAAAAGLVLTGVAAGWAAPWLPEWLGTVIGWVGQQPDGKKTALLVISAILISALNYRYVNYRKIWNLDKGTYTRPRQNALLGAVLAAVPAIANNLVQLSAVPVLVALFAQYNWVAAAVVAFLGTFFQRRQMGGQLTWNAGSDAVYAVPMAFLLAALQWAQPTASWAEYLSDIGWWVLAVAPAAMLIDYWIYYLALPVEKLSRWMHKRSRDTARRIRAGASEETSRWRVAQLRNRNHRRLDFETFSHPNWLVSFWKSPDSITKAVLTYFIVRPIPGVPENGYSITLRILVAIGVLVLSWRTRNVIELLLGILGYLSPRSMARRSRPIGWFWRLTRRADPHPRWFWRLFGHRPYAHRVADLLEIARADLAGDAQLPATLAERLVESLLHDLPPPVELDELSKGHAAQVAEVKDQWSLVDEKTRRALSLALLLVATNREALTGAAGRIDGRARDVVGFVDRLAHVLPGISDSLALTDADRERLGLGSGGPLSRTVLEKLLLETIKDLYAQRLVYLRDHLLPLLYTWRGGLPRASEEANRAELWILYTEGEMELAARPKIDSRGLVAARNLLADQHERVRENRKTEQVRPTASGWIDLYRRNSDALLILDASLAVLEEVELHRAERAYWRERLALAVATADPAPENTLLAVLLTAASQNDPLTARDLADRYQGPAVGWQRMLNDLAGAGLLTGNATDGYTVTDELRKAWRAARPKLRHALRANPELLPGGGRLQPLRQRTSWNEAGTKRAHDALLDLLAIGDQVLYARADPGFIEAVRRRWQAIYGWFYQREHPLSAAEQAPKPDRKTRREQLTAAVEELTNAIQVVQDRREELLRAEFAVKQQLHAADPNRDQTGRPDLRATDPKEVFDAKSEFDRISQVLEKALEKLGKIVDQIRDEDYPHVGARPPKLSILLEDADSLLAMGAGQIAPVPAEIELRRSVDALLAADRALARAGTADEREAALHQARVALIRFRYAARTIREKGATIRLRAWWHVRVGERRARKLIEHDRPALVPAFALPTGHETAAAGSVPLDLPGGVGAAMSNPGTMPHARNHDFADAHYDPATGVITVVVADGLSAGFQSELAARLAVRTALTELTRTDREDRTPEQAHRFAAAMAAARVAAMARPGQAYPPATTYLAVQVFPGKGKRNRVVVSNLGDTHAYIERNGDHTRLTFNHVDRPTGGLTGFLGENPLVPPYVRAYRPRTPGHLLLATDGLHIHGLDELLMDAALALDDTPAERVQRLIDAGRAAGGRDNLTAVDIPFPLSPPPGGHGGHSGAVIAGGWRPGEQERFEGFLAAAAERGLLGEYDPAQARAPPSVDIPLTDEVLELLAEHGLAADLPERLVAFAWSHPAHGRVIVMFAHTAAEIAELVRLGLLRPEWRKRLAEHERNHLDGTWEHWGAEAHDDDAGLLLAELADARARAARPLAMGEGTVARTPMTAEQVAAFGEVLAEAFAAGEIVMARLPRHSGPPAFSVDAGALAGPLAARGLGWLPEQLLVFGWQHPERAPYGARLFFVDTLAELLELTSDGLLTQHWWRGLADPATDPAGSIAVWDRARAVSTLLLPHDRKPTPKLHGEGPLYLGLELEVNIPAERLPEAIELASWRLGDLGYLKEDGSIETGFEIVTHPMSYRAALEEFPWELLDELAALGADGDDVGLHVHLSRDGFDSPDHAHRWMLLIHHNREPVTTLARRYSSTYAAFLDEDRERAGEYARGKNLGDFIRAELSEKRNRAINTMSPDTFELRVFASALGRQQVAAALGFAAASVAYTRDLPDLDATRDWAAFIGWLADRPEYAPLLREWTRLGPGGEHHRTGDSGPRGPPPGGGLTTRPLHPREHDAVVRVLQPYLDTLTGGSRQRSRTATLDWTRWARAFTEAGLPEFGAEMIAYTVFDSQGRPWWVQFEHVREETDRLIRFGFLDADYDRLRDEHEGQHSRGRPHWDNHDEEAAALAAMRDRARARMLAAVDRELSAAARVLTEVTGQLTLEEDAELAELLDTAGVGALRAIQWLGTDQANRELLPAGVAAAADRLDGVREEFAQQLRGWVDRQLLPDRWDGWFWRVALALLPGLHGTAGPDLTETLAPLREALGDALGKEITAELTTLLHDPPAWMLTAFAGSPTGDGGTPSWLSDNQWRAMSLRARLTVMQLTTVTGAPRWLAGLPRSAREREVLEGLLLLFTDQGLRPVATAMTELWTGLPLDVGGKQRAGFLNAWIGLGHAVAGIAQPLLDLDLAHTEAPALLAGRTGADELKRAEADLLALISRRVGRLIGANLDEDRPPVPLEPGTDRYEALVNYHDASGDLLLELFARYMEALQAHGGDEAVATEAFWSAWRERLRPSYVAHEHTPDDRVRTLATRAQNDPGERVPVIVGAARHPVEKLSFDVRGDSCMNLASGMSGYRPFAQHYLLHPRIVVVYVWRRLPEGSRGDRLARISAMVTDQGILPLDHGQAGDPRYNYGQVFTEYLTDWATRANLPLLLSAERGQFYRPLALPPPAGTEDSALTMIRLPGYGTRVSRVFFDVLGKTTELPREQPIAVRRWLPPALAAP